MTQIHSMAEANEGHAIGNGDVKHHDARLMMTNRQVNLQRIRDKAQHLRGDLLEQLNHRLDDLFDTFINEVEQIEQDPLANNNIARSQSKREAEQVLLRTSGPYVSDYYKHTKRKNGELPDKVFINRRSVLTELLESSHIRTIYHIFVAILIVFSLNTLVYDWVEKGTLNLNFNLIVFAFGKFPKVMSLWVCMQLSTLLVVYPAFYYWASHRKPTPPWPRPFQKDDWYDGLWLVLVVLYQTAFILLPVMYVVDNDLPPASSVVITCEQLRLMMKTHAFIRENAYKVLHQKKSDDGEYREHVYYDRGVCMLALLRSDKALTTSLGICSFSFCVVTKTIQWRYVVSNFGQVLACLFYTYYIFERFCVPVFQNFNREHVTPKALMLSVFGSMMPATLVLFIGFFAILHSWLNAFAEMLRFGDRLFYKDWWNSTTFSNYYRTWNVVVHDWLYCYVYKDMYKLLGSRNRAGPMAMVFLISAVFHEYVLVVTFRFFYPVLFIMFAGAGFGFIFLTDKGSSRSWNVFMWVMLFIGNGLLMCLYSMEWYARRSCPVITDNFMDYLIPRSWMCDFAGINLH